ncbi:putative ribonuclease H-like domain-containing protein [Tanacetum coccineum]
MAGSDNESDDASVHSEATIAQQQQNIQPQIITTVSNNNAKFPYLKKDEYEVWAMKMEYWITNNDMNIWKVIQNGNSLKRTGRDRDGRVIILPPTTADEHIAVQRESKARTTLLQSIPDDHVADFHYMDDARDIWNAVKARKRSNVTSVFKEATLPENAGQREEMTSRDIPHSRFRRLERRKKITNLEKQSIFKGYSTSFHQDQSAGSKPFAFVSVPPVLVKKMYMQDNVLQSFVADTEPEKQLAYEIFEQIEKMDLGGDGLGNGNVMVSVMSLFTPKEFGMIAGYDTEDAIEEGVAKIYNLITGADTKEASTAVQAYKNSLKTLEKQKRVLQKNQLTLEDKIRVLSIELENTTNLLKHSERINAIAETAKKELQTKLDNHLVQIEKWRTSSKNLFRLIDSSMSVRTKVGLGFNNYIRENELGWDDSAFSVFTTNSEEVEGRPLFNRFAKADSMKAVPPPLSGDYTPLSDHIDLDESQMSYGTKSSTSGDSNSVSNDFVSCDNSDKSSEVNTNDFASSDSSVKSSEPKLNDSTSCASTSSVSTSESEAEIESNVGTPIQEPIIVQDLPSFSCNSSDKNENTSRTSCNKNGYFNKKAGHFRKNASSVSKLCFVCGSSTHLIKDCDFYEKQMANKTVGNGVGPVHSRNNVNHQNQFVPQAVLLRTGKVNIPPARPQPVPTGKPKVPAPVPTGRQNRPFPVPTDRGYSPSVTSGWWKSTARPMPHLNRPTSSYFQTYTPYVPQMYYNHMKYGGVRWATAVKPSAGCSWKTHRKGLYWENPYSDAEDEGIFDSGCSRSMTGNMERLDDFQEFQGGKVTFGGGEGRITGKGTIRTPTLDFENVYYVKELQQFNLFSISQICDKKNRVLFTDTDCLVLSKDFMLPDESMVVLRVPRKHNLYTINLNNLSPRGNLACLVAKASVDESVKWHRRMGHVNYKNMNRLVKGNLVRGLPPKLFKNDHTCVACCKGKQHKASYKAITAVSSISEPLQLLHMDLFGPTSIRSIDHKYYCLVITDDYSRFCWVFFLEHKDETYPILKDFINLVENQLNKKVKAIRCDNGTEFKNAHIIELCGSKGIKRDYSNARTPQQNGVAERKNRTLIEAARTMLADSKLPTMFWTEAVRTACYVLNRVLVTSPHNKTPYALLTGNIPSVSHFKPFGCHVTILNTSDHLGKFDGKADEGYIVGYSASNRAYRVYNVPNKRVEETMNLRYLEEKPNVQGLGHEWYFDLDYLTDTLGYKRDKANQSAGTQEASTNPASTQDADSDSECDEQVIIFPSYPSYNIQEAEPKDTSGDEVDDSPLDSAEEIFQQELARLKGQEQRATSDAKDDEELQKRASTKLVPPGSIPVPTGTISVLSGDTTVSPGDVSVPTGGVPVPTGSPTDSFFDDEPTTRFPSPSDLGNNEPSPGIFSSSSYDDEFGVDLNNLASTVEVSPVATKRINTLHPQSLILVSYISLWQTRSKVNKTTTYESAFIIKPRSVAYAFEDPSWVDAIQEEMQQFKFQNVWVLVDLPEDRRRALIMMKWNVKSAFHYGRLNEEVYMSTQPKGFMDPQHPKKVYKVDKCSYRTSSSTKSVAQQRYHPCYKFIDTSIFGIYKKAWCNEFEALIKGEFEMSVMGELTFFLGLHVQQRPDGMFISQDKYVQEILKKFDLESVRTATTPYEAPKPKSKNAPDSPVNVHLYRSLIGSLMYLTTSRPDIMFAVSACSWNQVTPTISNLEAVKKIFFKKSTTVDVRFWGRMLISVTMQDSKQLRAISSTESCVFCCCELFCGQNLLTNLKNNVEDEPLGGSFHASPPRSTQAPPAGYTSGGAEDLITLTALSLVVSTCVQKVTSLENLSFKDTSSYLRMCRKLSSNVKSIGGKLKPKKRKVVVSDSDQEEGGEQAVDLDALIALANAAVTVDSNIPPCGPSNNPAASSHIPTDTKKQLADERLSEIEAARLEGLERERYEKEKAEIARQDAIYAKKLEQEEEMSVSQRETRQAEAILLLFSGADVNDDNFAERMVALINQRKRAFAEQKAKEKRDKPMTPAQQREYMRVFVKNQSTTIYSTGWSMKYVKSLSDEQLIAEFEKIRMTVADLKSHELRRTLKRAGEALELDTSKKQKSTEAPIPYVPVVPQPPVVSSSPKSSGTRGKRDTADEATYSLVCSAGLGGELYLPLGEINALYRCILSSSVNSKERMLKHKLEIDNDVVGNDLTQQTAEQFSSVHQEIKLLLPKFLLFDHGTL